MSVLDNRLSDSEMALAVAPRPRRAIWLHWLTLAPLLLAYVAILGRDEIDDRAWRAALLWAHQCSGAAVFGLALARLTLRWRLGAGTSAGAAHRLDRIATLGHALLYVAMLGVPLLGWSLTTALGHAPPWGWGLPGLAEDEDLADRLGGWHDTAAWTWAVLIGLHVAAALFHHFVLRDDVLRAMLRPRDAARSPRSSPSH